MFDIEDKLSKIIENNLFRDMFYFSSPQDKIVNLNGNNMLLFSSNNYLSLCNDEEIKMKSKEIINNFGIGSGGSRLTTGSTIMHKECENTLSKFKNKEDSILYSSGYLCNIGSISSLFYEDYILFSDELNHSSIISGIKLSKSKCVIYKHSDMDDLREKLRAFKYEDKKVILTDGVFSMDGDICKLDSLLEICYEFNCYLYLDDAHGTGVLGEQGRGTCSHFNIEDDKIILMGTGSKALGCVGGFISSNSLIISYLRNTSRSFIFSTSQTPENAKSLTLSIEKCITMNKERSHLRSMSIYLRESLKNTGYEVINGITPIVPVILKSEELSIKFREEFLKDNIFITPIRPPSVPKGTSRIRVTLSSSHSKEDIDKLIHSFKRVYIKYEKYIKGGHQ